MTLSTSRQQFLAYESQTPEDIQYGRKGGIFVTTCVCISLIILAVVFAALVGIIVYYITFFKLAKGVPEVWDDNEPFGNAVVESPDLRLPTTVVPSYYRLKIKTDLDNSTFTGTVAITLRANKKLKEIILHAKDLTIDHSNAKLTEQMYEKVEKFQMSRQKRGLKVESDNKITNNSLSNDTIHSDVVKTHIADTTTPSNKEQYNKSSRTMSHDVISTEVPKSVDSDLYHSSVKNIKIISVAQSEGDQLVLTLATLLKPGIDYTLELPFKGNISEALLGFYSSSYVNEKHEERKLGVTQFEPISARAAFPCFDEPQLKAMFEISVAHNRNLSVLSNMKVAGQEDLPEDASYKWTHFERSVNMSTYLVAYVVSDFEYLETNYTGFDNISKPIRVWTRPGFTPKAQYALNITPALLAYYEELFGLPYALDKLDLIAVPDFSSSAMENWGLITFRETALLFDETTNVARDKQTVAIDVAHELAHQWFGNLVTMRWWTDLWLNEGFATYIEALGVDKIAPEWKTFESFTGEKMELMRTDSLKNTSPISREVIDASEISQKFDEISYVKGANLIRMLKHTISDQLFHQGLLNYLNEWKFSNAEENDLWNSMTIATKTSLRLQNVSVQEFMNSWTRQPGFPVVDAIRNYATGEVTFTQSLFTTSKTPYKHMIEQKWTIPISYTSVQEKSSSNEPKVWLKDISVTVPANMSEREAMYVNVDAIGYYRVNYDQQNWKSLRESLRNGLITSPVAKAQLIDDAFNLAKVGRLDYSYALDLATYVKDGEDSRLVWEMLLNNMVFLRYNLKATPGFGYFQDFIKLLLTKQLTRLNFGVNKPKNDVEAFLIENLMYWDCYVESERCLKWAKSEFDRWSTQQDLSNNTIPTHLRTLVFNMALRHGGRKSFDILWNLFQNTTDPSLKSLIIENLPSTREEGLIVMLLEKSLTDLPKQYSDVVWNVDSTAGSRIAQEFFYDNWQRVYDKFIQLESMFSMVLTGTFGGISTQYELDRLKEFAVKHKKELLPMSQTMQKIVDMAVLRVEWIRKHGPYIGRWLKNYLTGGKNNTMVHTNATTSGNVPTSTIQTLRESNLNNRTVDNFSNEVTTQAPSSINATETMTIKVSTTENTTNNSVNNNATIFVSESPANFTQNTFLNQNLTKSEPKS